MSQNFSNMYIDNCNIKTLSVDDSTVKNLTISQSLTLNNVDISSNKDLYLSGIAKIKDVSANTLKVGTEIVANSTINQLTVTDASSVTLNVSGRSNLSSVVSGDISSNKLVIGENATILGTFATLGVSTFGNVGTQNLLVSGSGTVENNLNVKGSLQVNGTPVQQLFTIPRSLACDDITVGSGTPGVMKMMRGGEQIVQIDTTDGTTYGQINFSSIRRNAELDTPLKVNFNNATLTTNNINVSGIICDGSAQIPTLTSSTKINVSDIDVSGTFRHKIGNTTTTKIDGSGIDTNYAKIGTSEITTGKIGIAEFYVNGISDNIVDFKNGIVNFNNDVNTNFSGNVSFIGDANTFNNITVTGDDSHIKKLSVDELNTPLINAYVTTGGSSIGAVNTVNLNATNGSITDVFASNVVTSDLTTSNILCSTDASFNKVDISGNFSVRGNATFKNITADAANTLSKFNNVESNNIQVDASGTLSFIGSGSNVDVTLANETINAVSYNTLSTSNVVASRLKVKDVLDVTATSFFSGPTTFTNGIGIYNASTFVGVATFNSSPQLLRGATIGNSTNNGVDTPLTVNGMLKSNFDASFNKNVDISGNTKINGTLTLNGPISSTSIGTSLSGGNWTNTFRGYLNEFTSQTTFNADTTFTVAPTFNTGITVPSLTTSNLMLTPQVVNVLINGANITTDSEFPTTGYFDFNNVTNNIVIFKIAGDGTFYINCGSLTQYKMYTILLDVDTTKAADVWLAGVSGKKFITDGVNKTDTVKIYDSYNHTIYSQGINFYRDGDNIRFFNTSPPISTTPN